MLSTLKSFRSNGINYFLCCVISQLNLSLCYSTFCVPSFMFEFRILIIFYITVPNLNNILYIILQFRILVIYFIFQPLILIMYYIVYYSSESLWYIIFYLRYILYCILQFRIFMIYFIFFLVCRPLYAI
jgi:hypothetical protein